jgi:predicted small integral membrane protein
MTERQIFTDRDGRTYTVQTRQERIQEWQNVGMILLGGMIGIFTSMGIIAVFFGLRSDAHVLAQGIIFAFCGFGGLFGGGALNMRLRDGYWF